MHKYWKSLITFFGVAALSVCSVQAQNKAPVQNWEFIKQDLGSVWEAVRPAGAGLSPFLSAWIQKM